MDRVAVIAMARLTASRWLGVQKYGHLYEEEPQAAPVAAPRAVVSVRIPPYGERLKAGFVPRAPEDFGDGGAFPVRLPAPPLPLLLPAAGPRRALERSKRRVWRA